MVLSRLATLVEDYWQGWGLLVGVNRILGGVLTLVMVGVALAPLGLAKEQKKKDEKPTVSYTPMPLDSGYGPMDIAEPPVAAEEIVRRFTEKESTFREAMNHYTYRRTVRVQTVDDDNKVDGEYFQIDDVTFDPKGKRQEKVVHAPANTLERISMSPADFQDIQERLPFVLTKEDVSQYDLKYVGKQTVDQVPCFVFEVAPKVIEKNKRYFQGKIWVDAEEFEIVVTSGKNVPDDLRRGHEDLSLPFTTYREQIDGANWFPTYTKGDGVLHFPGGIGNLSQDVHLRQTVKYTDYKQFGSETKIIYDGKEISNTPESDTNGPVTPPVVVKPK